jgi:hypothetical protein
MVTTGRWLQPPILSPSCALKYKCQIMMKPLSHYHCEYTTINLYQSVPTTCNQPAPITCDQPVPVIINKITCRYVTCIYCNMRMYMTCLYYSLCMYMSFYTAACIHLQKARVFTFLKLKPFVASVTSTCNLSQPVPINMYQSTYTINHVHQSLTQPVPSQVHQLCTSQYLITITKTKMCF